MQFQFVYSTNQPYKLYFGKPFSPKSSRVAQSRLAMKRDRSRQAKLSRAFDVETVLPEEAFVKTAKIARPDRGLDYRIYLPHAQTAGSAESEAGQVQYTTTMSDICPALGDFYRLAQGRGREIRAAQSNLPILRDLLGPRLSAALKSAPVPAPTIPRLFFFKTESGSTTKPLRQHCGRCAS